MRIAFACLALFLLIGAPAHADRLPLDQRTRDYLDGAWTGRVPPGLDDYRSAVSYEFEFAQSGGVLRYSDSVDIDDWWRILTAKRIGSKVAMKVSDKHGRISTHWFRISRPDGLVELGAGGGNEGAIALTREAMPARLKVDDATIAYFSNTPPHYATFTHKPWAKTAGEACRQMPNAKSFAEFNLLAPSGAWLVRQSAEGMEDWRVISAKGDATTGSTVLRLVADARRPANNASDTTITVERIGADKIRVPAWNEEFFRCTAGR